MVPLRHLLLALSVAAAGMSGVTRAAAADEEPFTPSQEFQDLVTALAREQLPDNYEKTRNWGKTARVFDGWKLERDGLRLETRRRWKEANDGAWQKYSIHLVKPQKHFDILIENVRQEGSKAVCDVTVRALVRASGRHCQWESGVQLWSISAEADARLRLRARLEIAMKLDAEKFPPDVYFEPRVASADLDILEFKLRRVSHFDGPVVKSLSASVREVLEDKIEEDRKKLVDRLNKSLIKQQSKLRFSASD